MRTASLAIIAACTFAAGSALAADLTVEAPWVRGTVSGQKASGAFMELKSARGGFIVGAASPVAAVTEIHEMKVEDGVMKMRAVPRLAVPAGQTVSLSPGGYHIMLLNLGKQLVSGESIPISLRFEGADGAVENVEVSAEVRDLTAGHQHDHKMH